MTVPAEQLPGLIERMIRIETKLPRETMEMSEAARWWNTERPLTHSLDLTEEGLAMKATRTCSVADCDRPHKAHGVCQMHYHHSRTFAPCAVDDCAAVGNGGRGWCYKHYKRWQEHGDPLFVHPLAAGPGRAGANHPQWLGPQATYTAAHLRVKATNGPAGNHRCCDCGDQADEWSYNHNDPAEKTELRLGFLLTYSTDPAFYEARCHSCHRRFDRTA